MLRRRRLYTTSVGVLSKGMARMQALLTLVLFTLSGFPLHLQDSSVEIAKQQIAAGNEIEARRLLEQVLTREPRDPQANFWMGYLHLKAYEYEPAIACLEVPGEKSREPDRLKLLAKAQILSGKSLEAENSLREVIRLRSGDAEGWSLLGQLYQTQNRFGEALKPLQTAIALNKMDVPGLTALAFTEFALGKASKAEETFRQAIRENGRLARPLAD
ncbi:MAG: hypothetical protein EHM23_22575, partial [Acidobacteria bacterium]